MDRPVDTRIQGGKIVKLCKGGKPKVSKTFLSEIDGEETPPDDGTLVDSGRKVSEIDGEETPPDDGTLVDSGRKEDASEQHNICRYDCNRRPILRRKREGGMRPHLGCAAFPFSSNPRQRLIEQSKVILLAT